MAPTNSCVHTLFYSWSTTRTRPDTHSHAHAGAGAGINGTSIVVMHVYNEYGKHRDICKPYMPHEGVVICHSHRPNQRPRAMKNTRRNAMYNTTQYGVDDDGACGVANVDAGNVQLRLSYIYYDIFPAMRPHSQHTYMYLRCCNVRLYRCS